MAFLFLGHDENLQITPEAKGGASVGLVVASATADKMFDFQFA